MAVQMKAGVDIMDIVSNPRDNLLHGRDRAGRIAELETNGEEDEEEGEESLVEQVRQQLRDAAGQSDEPDTSDDRFIAAFKAALVRSHAKEAKAMSKGQNSLWLSKMLDRSKAKISRDNLTRKLYGGGTGRWDRDWDIAFWKEKALHLKHARKAAVGDILGSGSGDEIDKAKPVSEAADSIFSRLYVADTSLFPRNDDVSPLSAQMNMKDGQILNGSTKSRSPKPSPSLSAKEGLLPGTLQSSESELLSLEYASGKKIDTITEVPCLSIKHGAPPDLGKGSLRAVTEKEIKRMSIPGGSDSGTRSVVLASDTGTKLTPIKCDVKKDKRQWALEVLARKTGATASVSEPKVLSGDTTCKGLKGKHLAFMLRLPVEMRPVVPHNRHSKVPTAVRQVQLNRFVEQELRMSKLKGFQNNPKCNEAIARAVSREEELCNKSNSKGVYTNLCVRALAHFEAPDQLSQKSGAETNEIIQRALEAAGLVDSPPASPSSPKQDAQEEFVSDNQGSKRKFLDDNQEIGNVLELDSLDIYGDFEFDFEDDMQSSSFIENSLGIRPVPGGEVEVKTSKLVVLLTTPNIHTAAGLSQPIRIEVPAGCEIPVLAGETDVANDQTSCATQITRPEDDGDDMYNELGETFISVTPRCEDANVTVIGQNLVNGSGGNVGDSKVGKEEAQEMGQSLLSIMDGKAVPMASVQDSRPKESKPMEDEESGKPSNEVRDSAMTSKGEVNKASKKEADDWLKTDKFLDLDRRIDKMRKTVLPKELFKADQESSEGLGAGKVKVQHSIQKQVEIYVNQHLKPLYRSGVITSDQFRWSVSRTACKVMEHHGKAMSADFLIKEGPKVKKLADQYLQAYKKSH